MLVICSFKPLASGVLEKLQSYMSNLANKLVVKIDGKMFHALFEFKP